jgi:hypothetical protein
MQGLGENTEPRKTQVQVWNGASDLQVTAGRDSEMYWYIKVHERYTGGKPKNRRPVGSPTIKVDEVR